MLTANPKERVRIIDIQAHPWFEMSGQEIDMEIEVKRARLMRGYEER